MIGLQLEIGVDLFCDISCMIRIRTGIYVSWDTEPLRLHGYILTRTHSFASIIIRGCNSIGRALGLS